MPVCSSSWTVRILTDPVFSRRASRRKAVGPARLHPLPCSVDELPPIDVVLISHDHYDHLDTATVVEIARLQPDVVFVCPLGVGAHLRSWGSGPTGSVWRSGTPMSWSPPPAVISSSSRCPHATSPAAA